MATHTSDAAAKRAATVGKPVANGAAAQANHDADWEQFQAFVAQVEQSEEQEDDAAEGQDAEDEGAAREAEESLENMQYVDRYRQALEHATAPSVGGGEDDLQSGKKRDREAGANEAGEEGDDDLTAIVREAAAEAAKRRRVAEVNDSDIESNESGEGDGDGSDSDSDGLEDLTNWRSKGI